MKRSLYLLGLASLALAFGCQQPKDQTGTPVHPTTKAGVVATAPVAATKASTDIIIDDADAGFTVEGDWKTAKGDYLKGEVHWAVANVGTAKATWTPKLPAAGMYAVYESHGEDPSNDHATKAIFTVNFDGGSKDCTVDLTDKINQWNLLGTFKFAAGSAGNVTLTNKADKNVIADGIKFVPVK